MAESRKDTKQWIEEAAKGGEMTDIPEVEQIIDEIGHKIGYMCKGHVSADAFIAGIESYGDDAPPKDKIEGHLDHTVMRCVPVPPNSDVAFSVQYVRSKPGRGAFKCTVWGDL